MRCSINVPNFGEFSDPRAVARLAAAAEASEWDGLFVWDHVVHDKRQRAGTPFGDPWMLLTAAALATSTLRIGTMVTPPARRRPEQLARQVATLDSLSGGRVVFGAGLGGPLEDEFASFGDTADLATLAGRLDESLELLASYWSGAAVTHHGAHYRVQDVTLLPATVQQPRPPVWIAGRWPAKRPIRRAALWDGVVPLFESTSHGEPPAVTSAAQLVDFVRAERGSGRGPFDIVFGGQTEPSAAADVVGPLVEVGMTWWDERQMIDGPDFGRLAPVLDRVAAGPPRP